MAVCAAAAVLAVQPLHAQPVPKTTTTYTYDAAGRLIAVVDKTVDDLELRPISYEYDNAGNRTRVSFGLGSEEYFADFYPSSTSGGTTGLNPAKGMRDGHLAAIDTIHKTGSTADEWIKADLGAEKSVHEIDVAPAVNSTLSLSAGTLNGAYLEYSHDGQTWLNPILISVSANTYKTLTTNGVTARYWRIRKAGGLALGEFRFFSGPRDAGGGAIQIAHQQLSTHVGGTVPVNLLAGVSYGRSPWTVTEITLQPMFGTLTAGPNPTRDYTSTGTTPGVDTFTFKVKDADQVEATGRVTIEILAGGVNLPPVANPDHVAAITYTNVEFYPLANDIDPEGGALKLKSVGKPSNGERTVDFDTGKVTYRSTQKFNDKATFDYVVEDAQHNEKTGQIIVDVSGAGTADVLPTGLQVTTGDSVSFNPVAAATFAVGVPTYEVAAAPTLGSAVKLGNGALAYTAGATPGQDNFTVRFKDIRNVVAVGQVSVAITQEGKNRAPLAILDESIALKDTDAVINVLVNDSDPDGDTFTIVAVSDPAHGTATFNADDRTVIYRGDLGYVGPDTLTYTIRDARGVTAQGSIVVTVQAYEGQQQADHHEVWAVRDTVVTGNGATVSFNPAANDIDFMHHPLRVVSVGSSQVTGNNLTFDPSTGLVTYFASAFYLGEETVSYAVSDGRGETRTGQIRIVVANNDPPSTVLDTVYARPGIPKSFSPQANDTDPQGDKLRVIALPLEPSHGTATFSAGGQTVTYTAAAAYTGNDTFQYRVDDYRGRWATGDINVVVQPNTPPVAVTDNLEAPANGQSKLDPLKNDTDFDSDPLSITGLGTPQHGTASIAPGGRLFVYNPKVGYTGPDSVTYTISDGYGGSATGTANIEVKPLLVRYLVVGGGGGGSRSGGGGGGVETGWLQLTPGGLAITVGAGGAPGATGGASSIGALVSALGGGGGSFAGAGKPGASGGGGAQPGVLNTSSLTWEPATGGANTAGQGYAGGDGGGGANMYTYAGAGGGGGFGGPGTAGVMGKSGDGGPGVDNDITGTMQNFAAGGGGNGGYDQGLLWKPGFAGGASGGNGGGFFGPAGEVLAGGKDASEPAWNHGGGGGGGGENGGVAAPGGGGFVVIRYPGPARALGGTVTQVGGDVVHTFTTSTTLNVAANAAPTAANDAVGVHLVAPRTFDPRRNDIDPDGDALYITAIGSPTFGVASLAADGKSITYTAHAGYQGADALTYVVADGRGGSATATVTFSVTTNVAPTAANDAVTNLAGRTDVLDVLTNDRDIDDDDLTITGITQPPLGAATIVNSGKAISYVGPQASSGATSFTYTISDGRGGTATATVSITLQPSAQIDYLVVAGGGGGAWGYNGPGGGGGGGGVLAGSTQSPFTSFAVTVGAGGLASTSGAWSGGNGGNSSIGSLLTAIGGGGGSGGGDVAKNGGSGGGGGGLGTPGQGHNGGGRQSGGGGYGGGGGASAPGLTPIDTSTGGNGGQGLTSSISGTSVVYGSGGGGGEGTHVAAGMGGAGAGSGGNSVGSAAMAGRGGGGGGGPDWESGTNGPGGAGGSGIVIIRYLTGSIAATGGTVTTSGAYTVRTFTSNGTFAIARQNAAPAPATDSVTAGSFVLSTFDPRGNDGDPDGDILTVVGVGAPAHGTVSIVSGGVGVTYRSTAGYLGSDSFTYTVADSHGATATGTVNVTVANTPPIAVNDSLPAYAGVAKTFDPRTNDSDPNGDVFTVTGVTTPTHGTASVGSGGTSVIYTATSGYAGSDSFAYTISDGKGGTATGTVNVSVTAAASVQYLVVGGGGQGGHANDGSGTPGGGGGGGEALESTTGLVPGFYAVTVGAGGTKAYSSGAAGANGGNSAIAGVATAKGGGGGGGAESSNAQQGGNGGGGAGGYPGAASNGSGRSGGAGFNDGGAKAGGGGGGQSTAGANANAGSGISGAGGLGLTSSISGTSTVYGSGGIGGHLPESNSPGSPATNGGSYNTGSGAAVGPAANRGGGGAGGWYTDQPLTYSGAAGIVIIRYTTGSMSATGGTVTTSGGYTIHTFTSSGTFTVQ